jgi:tRNA-splicing ligase RtcB
MNMTLFERISDFEWRLPPTGRMLVPGILYGDEPLLKEMDDKVAEQLAGVASLPGIVQAAMAMPDAHWGYGFPIGGVAAFDPRDGVVSAGGVGFDIACGVRTLHTGLAWADFQPHAQKMAEALFHSIPAGVGSKGHVKMKGGDLNAMLKGGAPWAVERGFGTGADLERIEDGGVMEEADPGRVSEHARERQEEEMGTLGSGNHYMEIQRVTDIYNGEAAAAFGLKQDDVVVSLHCGSRGLGHQVATDYSKIMLLAAAKHGIVLAERELACAPLHSPEGKAYWGAMNAATNCALANRQILTHLVRETFAKILDVREMPLLYDVCHNTCKKENHEVDGATRSLYVHRKGATRAFGPGHPSLPSCYRPAGQPVLVGGSMGTASHILAGMGEVAFSSACHGSGRRMSRHQAMHTWQGKDVVKRLELRSILIKSPSLRGVAEEAPQAYKDVDAVAAATEAAGLARRVCRLEPLVCVKG